MKIEELFSAARSNDVEKVRSLLEADVDACDEDGRTALMDAASWNGNEGVIKILIEAGAAVNVPDLNGNTALMIAASENGNEDVVKILIEAGADVNAKNKDGMTALMRAVLDGESKEAARILIENGADVNAANNAGCSALLYAIFDHNVDMVKMLLENGAGDHSVDLEHLASIASSDNDMLIINILQKWRIVVALGLGKELTEKDLAVMKLEEEFVRQEIKFQASLNNRLLLRVLAHAGRLEDWLVLDARNEENVDVPESYAALKSAYKRISDEFAKEHFCVLAVRRFENGVRYRAMDARYFEISPNTDLLIASTQNAAGVEDVCLRIMKILDKKWLSLEDVQFALDFINHDYLGMVLDHIRDGVAACKKEDCPALCAFLLREEKEEKRLLVKLGIGEQRSARDKIELERADSSVGRGRG